MWSTFVSIEFKVFGITDETKLEESVDEETHDEVDIENTSSTLVFILYCSFDARLSAVFVSRTAFFVVQSRFDFIFNSNFKYQNRP